MQNRSDVRIWCDKKAVGVGFVVDEMHVMTCAHVVADALDNPELDMAEDSPRGEIVLDFPILAEREGAQVGKLIERRSVVEVWRPRIGAVREDVAILRLRQSVPDGILAVKIGAIPVAGDRFRAFGVTATNPEGVVVEGEYSGPTSKNRALLKSATEDNMTRSGCSGGAAWNLSQTGILGMIINRSGQRQGEIIPINILKLAWPIRSVMTESNEPRDRFRAVHSYGLLETRLAGRKDSIAEIDAWINEDTPILVIEQYGGFGKSALAWTWWKSQREGTTFVSGFWFGFEGSQILKIFFVELHAHLTGGSLAQSELLSIKQLSDQTLRILHAERHVLVLDGFERMLLLSGAFDGNHESSGVNPTSPNGRRHDNRGPLHKRNIAESILAGWLRGFEGAKSRVLITSRYMPADLEIRHEVGIVISTVKRLTIEGLSLSEARDYWSMLGLDPNDTGLPRLVKGVLGHPLSIGLMAGRLRRDLRAKRKLSFFFKRNPGFALLKDPVKGMDGRDDVFDDALAALDSNERFVLDTVAALEFPLVIEDLIALFVTSDDDDANMFGWLSEDDTAERNTGPSLDEEILVEVLIALEERKLLARSQSEEWDMHPILRNVVRDRSRDGLRGSHELIIRHYERERGNPMPSGVSDLRKVAQRCLSLIRCENWQAASETWAYNLSKGMRRIAAHRETTRILDSFFDIDDQAAPPIVRWRHGYLFGSAPIVMKEFLGPDETASEYANRYLKSMYRAPPGFRMAWEAAHDFSMAAAVAHEALGEFDLAKAMFEIHNEVCAEPLCKTMQIDAYYAAARFAEGDALIIESIAQLENSSGWTDEPKQQMRLADVLFDHFLARGNNVEARLCLARIDRLVLAYGREGCSNADSDSEMFIDRALRLSRICLASDSASDAKALALEAFSMASAVKLVEKQRSAKRQLARAHFAAGEHYDADQLFREIIEWTVREPSCTHLLRDRADLGRNLIYINHDSAEYELKETIDRAETLGAVARKAKTLQYLVEFYRITEQPANERESLLEILTLCATHPRTPANIAEIRRPIVRLQEAGWLSDLALARYGFGPPTIFPRTLATGSGPHCARESDLSIPIQTFPNAETMRQFYQY